jgi:hypothetical protein
MGVSALFFCSVSPPATTTGVVRALLAGKPTG